MKAFAITIALLVAAAPMLYASHTPSNPSQYLPGTVLSVHKYDVSSPADALTTPTDAPLSSRSYAYDVTVRVDCKTYVARYETAFNYLPSAFTANQPIRVQLTKHVLYFDLPDDPEVKMGIVHRSTVPGAVCGRNR